MISTSATHELVKVSVVSRVERTPRRPGSRGGSASLVRGIESIRRSRSATPSRRRAVRRHRPALTATADPEPMVYYSCLPSMGRTLQNLREALGGWSSTMRR